MPPDAPDLLSTYGPHAATLAVLIWFGRRFLQQHDQLLARLDAMLAESAAARLEMARARDAFQNK